MRIDHLGTERLTWRDLLVFVRHCPPESALVQARDPDAWISPEIQMLRELEYGVRVLAWLQTDDAQRGENAQNRPRHMPLTKAELVAHAEAQKPEYDPMTLDEAADFLGWERQFKT